MMTSLRNRRLSLVVLACLLLVSIPAGIGAADKITWKTRGPGGGGNYFPVGVHPDDANIVLMGSDTGGIYRSTDGGQTWKLANDGLADPLRYGMYAMHEFTFTFDPVNHNTVYLGTLKSANGGANWHETMRSPYLSTVVNAIDPGNTSHVYAAGYANVYRSDCAWDGPGCNPPTPSCSTLPDASAFVRSMVLDPHNANHVIVCSDKGIYESLYPASPQQSCAPQGNPWQWVLLGGSPPNSDCSHLALDASGQTLFATFVTHTQTDCTGYNLIDATSWTGGIYKMTVPNVQSLWSTLQTPPTWQNISGANDDDDPGLMTNFNPGFETGPDQTHPVAAHWKVDYGTVTRESVTGRLGSSTNAMKVAMSGSGGGSFTSDPIALPNPGQAYRVSAWAHVQYPTTSNPVPPATCSRAADGCTLGSSFHLRFYYWQDANATIPMSFPGYVGNGQTQVLDSTDSAFDPALRNNWRRFETLMAARTGGGYITINIFTDGNCTGATWVDDLTLQTVSNLPRTGGALPSLEYSSYNQFVVDPTDANTIYVGTQNSSSFAYWADYSGVWKTINGGTTWSLVTRAQYHDNVLDGYLTGGACGDTICNGRGENLATCPQDCAYPSQLNGQNCGSAPPAWSCGDNVCAAGEHGDNACNLYCDADCPVDPDPDRNIGGSEYFDAVPTGYLVWGLGIGSGAAHNTVYFGSYQVFGTTNGGGKWTELSSDPQSNSTVPRVTWKQRGDTNAVVTYAVATDARKPGRIYYGDTDNELQISYDGGASFAKEGLPDWSLLTPNPIMGDSCTAIVLDKPYPGHAGDANTIFVGIGTSDLGGGDHLVGAAKGVFNEGATSGSPWTWSTLGDPTTLGQTGGVDLVRDDSGKFYASVYGSGVYSLPPGATSTTAWTNTFTGSNWSPVPTAWNTYRIARDATSGRLYVSLGNPYETGLQAPSETGVWASENSGSTWTKIGGTALDCLAIGGILPNGPNTLLVAAGDDGVTGQLCNGVLSTNRGGIYRGVRDSGGSWTFTQVRAQPRVSAVAISPADNSLVYAFASQVCCYQQYDDPTHLAGIWKSTDGASTWGAAPLANNGLMDLGFSRLTFSENDPHILYSSSPGAGVFEGTIACDDPLRDNECSTRVNSTNEATITGGGQTGGLPEIQAGSLDDTEEILHERTSGSSPHLSHVWSFPGGNSAVSYELVVEGYQEIVDATGSFRFTFATKTSGNCTGTETYGSTILTVSKQVDDDQVQKASLGFLPVGKTVFCIKLTEPFATSDYFHLDRLYLHAKQPLSPQLAVSDYLTSPGTRSGTFAATQTSDDLYEVLIEAHQGPKVALTHIWQFPAAQSASSYLLHIEGNADEVFQFAYSTNGTTFTDIPGAVINSDPDIPGGSDFVFGVGGLSGTLYIRVKNVNQQGPDLHSVAVDYLTIRAVP